MCFVRFTIITTFVELLLFSTLFGQTAIPGANSQTFHIGGTIRSSSGYLVDGARVRFQSKETSKTVLTDNKGIYGADLLLGDYTMTIQSPVFITCHRPLFRVASPIRITFDFSLHPAPISIDPPNDITDPKVRAAVQDASKYDMSPYVEQFLPAPSTDGLPFQLYVHYAIRSENGKTYTYSGDTYPPYNNPVFVAYNLFSLQADKVIYDLKNRTIKATGNVVVEDGSGATQRADSMTLKIEYGQATPLH